MVWSCLVLSFWFLCLFSVFCIESQTPRFPRQRERERDTRILFSIRPRQRRLQATSEVLWSPVQHDHPPSLANGRLAAYLVGSPQPGLGAPPPESLPVTTFFPYFATLPNATQAWPQYQTSSRPSRILRLQSSRCDPSPGPVGPNSSQALLRGTISSITSVARHQGPCSCSRIQP